MNSKVLFRFLFLNLAVVAFALLLVQPAPVRAQCGQPQPSSCTTCHAQEDPISEKGKWHIVHAGQDICINCHGGNASAVDKALAHEGLMAQPLADIYTDCHSCHPDYEARAAKYAPIAGVTAGSCATPTAIAVSNIVSGPPAGNVVMPSDPVPTTLPIPYALIGVGAAIVAFLFLMLGWLAGHRS